MAKKKVIPLRSVEWFGRQDIYGFIYRSWVKNRGVPQDQFDGRPVIGICNTWSELTPCNTHFRVIAEHVKAGVLEAGGFPLEFPVMSLGETLLRPTAMLYRNLASMDVEESIRGNPLDGTVLLVGCDKTTPALLMGAASVDLPAIAVSGGPMLSGKYRGTDIGSGTNVWSMSEDLRAGKITLDEFHEAESCMHRSHGHCMTMGTASTMACVTEALGLMVPGGASPPAAYADRLRAGVESGRAAVALARQGLTPERIMTAKAFENAVRVLLAIGGSTNGVVHLTAMAGRLGLAIKPEGVAIGDGLQPAPDKAAWAAMAVQQRVALISGGGRGIGRAIGSSSSVPAPPERTSRAGRRSAGEDEVQGLGEDGRRRGRVARAGEHPEPVRDAPALQVGGRRGGEAPAEPPNEAKRDLARRIVEEGHGGRLTYEPVEVGARFAGRLPRNPRAWAPVPSTRRSARRSRTGAARCWCWRAPARGRRGC